ncbi:hypothetical protein C4D60_Mb02t14330 [Musa balbisiana]|uniref:Uncharacterized protein n=1 Tax=Musa balbisiana TaxID=52838 RepID=A0A4S8ICZ4_MUSBA|nr:hypothetical protein C4D60_Mb02t14330 [Musa balbisiana]
MSGGRGRRRFDFKNSAGTKGIGEVGERECVCVSLGSGVAREKAMREPECSRPPLSVGDVRNAVPEGKIEFREGDSRITISSVRVHADIVDLGPKSAGITNPSPFRGYARS